MTTGKIYFAIKTDGYWRGLATTERSIAEKWLAENNGHRIGEADLMPVDFVPTDATICGPVGSCQADLSFTRPEDYLCFNSMAYRRIGTGDARWMQAIRKSSLPILATTGAESHDFQEELDGLAFYFKKPE